MFENDMKTVFGESDQKFKRNFNNTLAGLKTNRGRSRSGQRFFKAALVAIAACLALSTAAFAMTRLWGVLDFIGGRTNAGPVLPDALKVVQQNLPQTVATENNGQPELATFAVREAVFDGSNIYIVLEAKPVKSDYMFLGADAGPADPISCMGPLFDGKTGTIGDYAKANGKVLYRASVGQISGLASSSADFVSESDGTPVYMITTAYDGDEVNKLNLSLPCVISAFTSDDGATEQEQETTLSFTVQSTGHFATASSNGSAVFADCGVTVDKVTLTASEMAVKVHVEYSITDAKKFAAANTNDGFAFEFLNDNGERIPDGPGGSGILTLPVDNTGTHYTEEWNLQAMETLPDHIVLRGFNSMDKSRYEAVTIPLEGN